ncbi:hypothetical protein L1987_80373 [Smallanthus sonchifolius]|uniref:Uncharacterized protein n=1 Tax=Smallanthus sonchifolius TaxID=185202 RepID=A0ACB8YMI8_9ASTR|nr:hypothetical protein L1987_80373 [Smallanthus sonchifolius]
MMKAKLVEIEGYLFCSILSITTVRTPQPQPRTHLETLDLSFVSDRRNPGSGSCSFLVLVLRSRISRFLNDSNKTSNIQQRFGLRALTGHGVVL